MEIAFLIGRIIFGLYLLIMASIHFFQSDMLSGYAASKGLPAAKLSVIVSGLLLLVSGLSFITGILPLVGVISLIVFLLPAAFLIHNFWTVEDEQAKMTDMTLFMRNIALIGAALMFLGIPIPWPLSL